MQQVRCNRRCDYATNRARLRNAIGYQRRAQFATIRAAKRCAIRWLFDSRVVNVNRVTVVSIVDVIGLVKIAFVAFTLFIINRAPIRLRSHRFMIIPA